jgi:hypothetical protein
MRLLTAAAMCAALLACSGQKSTTNSTNGAAPAGNGSNAAAANGSSASNASTGTSQASAPAAAYRRYFDERWGGTGGAAVTPAEVTAMLQGQTAQQTVNALYGTGENSRWDTVAKGIAKGDPAWLEVAVRLSAGTDAGTSDDFGMAAQDALTTNPTGALRLLSQIPMGTGGCSENGFEVPPEQARTYYETALASVATVTDPALQEIKSACVAELRKGLAEYPGLNGNPPQKMGRLTRADGNNRISPARSRR